MTPEFVADLCGFRPNGNPSTSDNNDSLSVEWGHALFSELGVPSGRPEVVRVGDEMERAAGDYLAGLRPDLEVERSRPVHAFEQYRHLRVFSDFTRSYAGPGGSVKSAREDLLKAPAFSGRDSIVESLLEAEVRAEQDHALVESLLGGMPEESLLKVDITVATPAPEQRLLAALSSKWTLRTDRAQDCISQGAKLVSQRRGQMPHYAVLTMEPRPAMLRLIAYGSGTVDCVYHLALDELLVAAEKLAVRRGGSDWRPKKTLDRMVAQRRLRSFDELCREMTRLLAPASWLAATSTRVSLGEAETPQLESVADPGLWDV